MTRDSQRILVIDDNPAIHDDFRKILAPVERDNGELRDFEEAIFGSESLPEQRPSVRYTLEAADNGQAGVELARSALANDTPFALAFVDMRMPAGWDGIETIAHLWQADPTVQVVICTAYSDYSWEDMQERLGLTDSLLILKKPFDQIEVRQLAASLCRKWELNRLERERVGELERAVSQRTNELRQSEERFATAFRAAPLPQAIIDFECNRIEDANEAFLQLTGCTAEALMEHRDSLLEATGLAVPLSGVHPMNRVDATIKSLSGEARDTQLFTQPTLLDGKPHLLLIARDITERRHLEAQLRHAQKMEAVGQLAAGVAHDFNNILTIIQGHLSLHLMSDEFSVDTRASLEEMLEASERAATLTRQLLTFSRKHLFQPGPVRLDLLLQRQLSLLRRLLGETIAVEVTLPENLDCIQGDAASIEQVVINLVLNARDAMPDGGRLTLDVAAVDSPVEDGSPREGSFIRLTIGDTGTGMTDEVKDRIFEPFYTTKEVGRGTGMGLATVYGILHQHQGWVEVESAPGQGTRFHVFLPVTKETPATVNSLRKEAPGKVQLKVLLVEDEPAVRAVMRQLLRHCGCEVTEAVDAHEGLKAWHEHNRTFELLVTDIVMPGGVSGHDLAKQLLAEKPELKIIYCSGYSAELFIEGSDLVPGRNFLPKPYSAATVVDLVRRVSEEEVPLPLNA